MCRLWTGRGCSLRAPQKGTDLGLQEVLAGGHVPPHLMNRVGVKKGKLGMLPRGTFPLRPLKAAVSPELTAIVEAAGQPARACSHPFYHGHVNWCRK